ncbi:hypothetical protein [Psychrobacter sp. UBA6739]|uniref:hypothetical protein n=1 Tax=Psychrobacter sp. UBA6739 TaxID=1947360 RepID=UPI0025DF9344|nr:hypothetical protein [Psychrobacter sp. UBA6739]
MKSNNFNYSLLAVGVAAVMGISTGATAAVSGTSTKSPTIVNVAEATYSVNNVEQPKVKSNAVTVNISEQISFSLLAQNSGNADDINSGGNVTPEKVVAFVHRLENTGNRTDEYTVNLSNITNGSGDQADYDLGSSTVSYQLFEASGTAATGSGTSGTDIPVNSILTGTNNVFTLTAGQYVVFTINAKTKGNKGGDTQKLTLTATSTALSTNTPAGVSKTLTNTDTSSTVLPVFGIVKSITDTLNLNDLDDTATYSIKVTNDGRATYAAAATGITVRDTLPAGLILVANSVKSTDATSGASVVETTTGTNQGFVYSGIDLAVGASVTITFDVKQDPKVAPVNGVINHARVEDTLDSGVTIIDSTNKDDAAENTKTYYPADDDTEYTNTAEPGTKGGDSAAALEVNKRSLTISNGVDNKGTSKEIAVDGTTIFTNTLTNTGDAPEGGTNRPITIKITDPDGKTPLGIITDTAATNRPSYKLADGTTGYLEPTSTAGEYRLPSSVIIASKGTVDIIYTVNSDGTGALNKTENNIVTITPAGNDPSAPAIATNTTTIKGLTLAKLQVLDANCDGTAEGTFVNTAIDAEPNQCVIYKIDATNTSTTALGFDITGLTILDPKSKFAAAADYVAGSATTPGVPAANITTAANDDGTNINTTITTLSPQSTATLQFRVKIKDAPKQSQP